MTSIQLFGDAGTGFMAVKLQRKRASEGLRVILTRSNHAGVVERFGRQEIKTFAQPLYEAEIRRGEAPDVGENRW